MGKDEKFHNIYRKMERWVRNKVKNQMYEECKET